MNNTRILYMGTPELSAYILKGIIEAGYNIVGVVSQEDKPVGRKNIIMPTPTKVVAMEHNIPVFQVKKIKEDYEFIKDLNIDLIITCAYGQIVPQGLLDIPTIGSFNIHGSLLPKYRGASPIQSALINGETVTGCTVMEMIDKMDAGDYLLKEEIAISKDDNYTSLYQKIAECGLKAALKALPILISKNYKLIPQGEESATYCKKILKQDEHLDLNQDGENFVNTIRGLSETPGGYLLLDDQVFKIYKARVLNDVKGEIGKIVSADKKGLVLQLKNNQVELLEVQKQGKKKMDYKSFLNGEKDILSKVLK